MWVERIAKVDNAARLSLNIKPDERRLPNELARRQGVSKTAAIHEVLSERSVAWTCRVARYPQRLLRAWHLVIDASAIVSVATNLTPPRSRDLSGAGPVRLVAPTGILEPRMVLVAGAELALAELGSGSPGSRSTSYPPTRISLIWPPRLGSPIARAVIRRCQRHQTTWCRVAAPEAGCQ